MNWNTYLPIIIDNSLHFILVIIFGLIVYILKKTFIEPVKELRQETTKHIDDCNKIPKALIIEKIDGLTRTVQVNHEYVKEMREEFKNEITLQRSRFHDLNNTLQTIGNKEIIINSK